MNKPSLFKTLFNRIAAAYGEKPGKMLVHTGVVGWILSSVAQVCAIVINDKIPNQQKMFLIPQEIADAGVNIISFYLITQGVKSFGIKLVRMGKLLPKSVKDFLIYKGAKDKLGKIDFDVFKSKLLTDSGIKRLNYHISGVDVVGTVLGTVTSCNIVTPIVRNEIAAHRQQKSIAKYDRRNEIAQIAKTNKLNNLQYPRTSFEQFRKLAYSSKTPSNNLVI